MMKIRCYYAHCIAAYGSAEEERDLETLNRLGFEVVNPNSEQHDVGYEERGMDEAWTISFRSFESAVVWHSDRYRTQESQLALQKRSNLHFN